MTIAFMTADTAASYRSSFLSVLAANMTEFCAGAREGREIETRYNALHGKTASELAQLGMGRADIARAALTGQRP